MQTRLLRLYVGLAMLAVLGLGTTGPAKAGFIVTLDQVGPNVVATGSGTLDLTDLTFLFTLSGRIPGITPDTGVIATGPTGGLTEDFYSLVTGPTSFGIGTGTSANSGTGNLVGIHGAGGFPGELTVPTGYVSGSFLSDTATYDNQSFSSLGVTPGIYAWTWGTGVDADSFTLRIVSVPEPASLAIFGAGLAALGVVRRKRKAS